MVTISRKTKRPLQRQTLWQIRLALYGLSALALLFSVCLVFTDLIAQQQQQAAQDGNTMMFPSDYDHRRKLANPDDRTIPAATNSHDNSGVRRTCTSDH
jgi:hypothetical protein